MAELPFRHVDGAIHVPEIGLWVDAHRPILGSERVVVTHAHSDHIAGHREVILTEPTSRLMRSRLGARGRTEHCLAYGRPAEFEWQGRRAVVTLFPAGHILGSAMVAIEWDGRRLLHTGDFQTRPCAAAEPCDVSGLAERGPWDYLVMETTFGRPQYRFPPAEAVRRELLQFCRDTLAGGGVPVLLGYALGKSQELLEALAGEGFTIMVHTAVERMAKVYEACGHRFPEYEVLDVERVSGKVVISPPGSTRASALGKVAGLRTALATGWAIDASCRFRSRVDAAFPLSDHADYDDLLEFVRRLAPRRVCTIHGFALDFAATLRERGVDACALGWDEQMTFGTLGKF